MQYAELFCQSNFSFLQGASHPQELVATAYKLGYRALAITDECSMAGVVRAYSELKNLAEQHERPFQLICGSLFRLQEEHQQLVLLAPNRLAYSEICQLISSSRLRAEKGQYQTFLADIIQQCQHALCLWLPPQATQQRTQEKVPLNIPGELKQHFGERLYIALHHHLLPGENQRLQALIAFAKSEQLPLVATNAVLMHNRSRKPLQDVLNANYHNCTLDQLGYRLQQNAERYLRSLPEIAALYPQSAIDNTLRIAEQCTFSLSELQYQYPAEVIAKNKTAGEYLRELVETGIPIRWPQGPAAHIRQQIEIELALIAELKYEHYFLTIYDIVQYARKQHILYQGRGSAANSVVCYCLFITEIDPHKIGLLFERFISRERNEPPDIDVDFEHERREEIIQYIYQKYGRERAGLAATKITYRFKSALRDLGKALGLGAAIIEQLQAERSWWDKLEDFPDQLKKVGIAPNSVAGRMLPKLLEQIYGFPRHLSQHVGGFVITELPLSQLVPIENAAMEDRTIVQWDKEDIEDLKLMKVDILALGMLTALRKALNYMALYGRRMRLQDIPADDPAVYDMMCRADTVGVFQIESRAQMSMLPRLQPRRFYELVIEIAIVRPGPIQGGMVHPYLRRKQKLEPITYPHENLRPVLERTLGVPIFQEQVIKLSMVAAGFSGGQADALRRAMASWGKNGNLMQFREKLIDGMLANGYQHSLAEQLFEQMKGFGSYGFPESHSASFALLAYFSAWIKCHHPAAFYSSLLNSQPMGFYAPAQLVYDAQRHNVKILPLDVNHSGWHHSLSLEKHSLPAIRLGLRLVKGLAEETAEAIETERLEGDFQSQQDFAQRVDIPRAQSAVLAHANCFYSISENRFHSTWQALNSQLEHTAPPQHQPETSQSDNIYSDYQTTGLTLREHPISLLRKQRRFDNLARACDLDALRDGERIKVLGLVTCRQRPGSAAGVLFLTLEDETGVINVVLWKQVQERYRKEILRGKMLLIEGNLQISRDAETQQLSVIHLIGKRLDCLAWKEIQHVRSFH
ncbi:error-prone DNA polymerase [Microbulbifer agarilyticus]|uniref:Error-prone DNA polymerase n=1 Tax=Microbulbifer agarilyticus TaxID=260552 RepID=A0A1Q2M2Y5_9GAMM|nr:error-prone DNA polymerase [Microbulbifer agarilyticus]AQQ67040.1 error-prone DNA polymerase [Microbulbifer agarilyticus]